MKKKKDNMKDEKKNERERRAKISETEKHGKEKGVEEEKARKPRSGRTAMSGQRRKNSLGGFERNFQTRPWGKTIKKKV